MYAVPEEKREEFRSIVRTLCAHPEFLGRLDPGLSGTRLLDQLVGVLCERRDENLQAMRWGSPRDAVIHDSYRALQRILPHHFPDPEEREGYGRENADTYGLN